MLKDVALDENSLNDTAEPQASTQQQQQTDKLHASHESDETAATTTNGDSSSQGQGPYIPENKSFSNLGNLGTIASGTSVASMHTQHSTDEKIYPHSSRIKKFPNHNYSGLYHALLNIIEIIPSIQTGQLGKPRQSSRLRRPCLTLSFSTAVGQALIHTFGCLAPFLADDLLESLPYTMALTLTTFPVDLHKSVLDMLCNCLLPISCKITWATS